MATAVFGGGSLDQLEVTAQRAGASGVWLQDSSGSFQLLVVGAPAFLKDGVKNAFPSGVPGFTAVTLTRKR